MKGRAMKFEIRKDRFGVDWPHAEVDGVFREVTKSAYHGYYYYWKGAGLFDIDKEDYPELDRLFAQLEREAK